MKENRINVRVKKEPGASLFSGWWRGFKLENYFEEGFPTQHLPKILFVVALGLFYIGNTHYTEKTIRKIDRMRVDVEDLRADYTTLKSNLMFTSKQSEVARKVKPLGLKESLTPPYKIVIEEGEY